MSEMSEAVRRQMDQMSQSMQRDRTGWTDEQWVADARELMDHLDGAVTSLLNGHINAMLNVIDDRRRARPRVIEPGPNQAAELDALPAETVLRWSDGVDVPIVIEKGPTRRWYETACAGSPSVSTVVAYNVPWTVLYLPA